MERTGWFECSDPLLNQLHENVVWGMRGNFLDVPTDCPQRDERLGWTGDIQVFSPTASFLYDVSGFLQSWLADLAVEQQKLGRAVPHVVPNVLGSSSAGRPPGRMPRRWCPGCCTSALAISASWQPSSRACAPGWIMLPRSPARTPLGHGFQFGDWLDPTAPPENPAQARTDKAIVATAYFARSAELVGRAAEVLGRTEDRQHYLRWPPKSAPLFPRVCHPRRAPDQRCRDRLCAGAGLWAAAHRRTAPARRGPPGRLVRDSGYHIRTGFVGTPLICDALCSTGHHQAAYRLLLQRECPSWLYPVTMGATTIWERWDSMLPDGSINPGEMTSFNHYALGAVADWMHRTMGGLAPAEPGYRRIGDPPTPRRRTHALPAAATSLPMDWLRCVEDRGRNVSIWMWSCPPIRLPLSRCPGVTNLWKLAPAPGIGRSRIRTPTRAAPTRWTIWSVRSWAMPLPRCHGRCAHTTGCSRI